MVMFNLLSNSASIVPVQFSKENYLVRLDHKILCYFWYCIRHQKGNREIPASGKIKEGNSFY